MRSLPGAAETDGQGGLGRGSPLRRAATILGVALLYYVTARASLVLTVQPAGIAAVWPPSGLLLAILVLTPLRGWPPIIGVIFLAIFGVNLSAGRGLPVSLGFGVTNCVDAAVAALALTWHRRTPPAFDHLRDVGVLAGVVLCVNPATALLGAAVATAGFGSPFWQSWFTWWIGASLGMLLVGTTILTWAAANPEDNQRLTAMRVVEGSTILVSLVIVSVITFGAEPERVIGPSPYLTFPLLLFAAVRFGPRGAAPAALLLAVIAVWFTAQGRGPFAAVTDDPALRVLEVQAFLMVGGFSALTLAALTSERRKANLALAQANATLEARVAERTAAYVAANNRLQREIAERVETEARLRESQERMRMALRVGRSFAFEWEPATDRVTRSEDCGEILGLAGDEAVRDTSRGYFARVHPADQAYLRGIVMGLTPAASTYRICYRLVRPDGVTVTLEETAQAVFDAAGCQVRLFGIANDVTERQRAADRAARLQLVTAALSAALLPEQVASVVVEQGVGALEATAGTVVVPDEASGDLVLIASAGYSPGVLGPWVRFPQSAGVPIAEAFRTGQPVWVENRAELLARYPGLEATRTENNAFASLPLVANGHTIGAMGISFRHPRSFSPEERGYIETLAGLCAQAFDRARLFASEQAARASAERAVQLRDGFLSIASHELKTPLTVLLGNAQLLQRRLTKAGDLRERDQRALAVLVEQARRLDRLIAMLFDVSRIDAGELRLELLPTDLRALLTRLVEDLQPSLSHHQVGLSLPDKPLTVLGDELRLEQLLQNLIHNAVKYSPQGGEVRVVAEATAEGVRMVVSDHGIGIPADELPMLFGRFFRASNTGSQRISGMGIGLYVAREIVERHGGTISVESVEGQGSTFTIVLPWPASVAPHP